MTSPAAADKPRQERNFHVLLRSAHKVNEPWLENQAIKLEESLIAECSGEVLGPSVTARFDENGFEVDLTVEAADLSEAYDKLGRALSVIERVADISIQAPSDEIRSSWETPERAHGESAVVA